MDQLKDLSIDQLIAITKQTREPIQFAQGLLMYLGRELSAAADEELAARQEAIKLQRRETKHLQISFAD